MKRTLLTTLALGAGLAIAAPVFAQQGAPGAGPQMHPMPGGPAGPGGFARMCEESDARLAGMLAYAEKRLNITDQQKAAWGKFADTARASAKPMRDLCAGLKDKPAPATGIERLERMDAMMTARQAQLHQMVPAVKEMYGQLSPEQQKIADEMLSRGPGPGHGHGHHHGAPGHDGPGFGPGGPRGG